MEGQRSLEMSFHSDLAVKQAKNHQNSSIWCAFLWSKSTRATSWQLFFGGGLRPCWTWPAKPRSPALSVRFVPGTVSTSSGWSGWWVGLHSFSVSLVHPQNGDVWIWWHHPTFQFQRRPHWIQNIVFLYKTLHKNRNKTHCFVFSPPYDVSTFHIVSLVFHGFSLVFPVKSTFSPRLCTCFLCSTCPAWGDVACGPDEPMQLEDGGAARGWHWGVGIKCSCCFFFKRKRDYRMQLFHVFSSFLLAGGFFFFDGIMIWLFLDLMFL